MSARFPYSAAFTIRGDPRGLRTVLLSIRPEMGESSRSNVEAGIGENELFLTIEAADVVALRAAINSFLRWVNESLEIYEGITRNENPNE